MKSAPTPSIANPSVVKPTVVKPSSSSLDHRLLTYSLAASAAGVGLLAFARPAAAEIVFTPSHAKLTNGILGIDLNHDGLIDFVLVDKGSNNTSSCSFCDQRLDVTGKGNVGAAVVGKLKKAAPITAGAVIGPLATFSDVEATGLLMASAFNDDNSFFPIKGKFANTKSLYLGLKFEISGQVHYGWVGFSVIRAGFHNDPYVTATLNGYAYQSVADTPIIAGKTSSGKAGRADAKADSQNSGSGGPTLGMLAMGAPALFAWRREEPAGLTARS